MPFAVNVVAVAVPELLVGAVVVAVALAKVPEAPVPGAVKTTEIFGTGLPYWSVTSAESVVENAVPTSVDCGVVPPVAATCAAEPAVFVSEKSAGELTPPTEAVTV